MQESLSGASVYLNNAATTWPKPPCVGEAMAGFLARGGANLGRGTSSSRDMGTLNAVLDCRLRLARLLGGYEGGDPRYVTFCPNVTEALNVVLRGFLRPGMSVLTTSMEHNAVVRPLRTLEPSGVKVTFLPCGSEGTLDPRTLADALASRRYDLMVLAHASNVCGTIQPLEAVAGLCADAGIPLVLDSAQTAGVLPLDAASLGLAALCFTGHKGLMGPQGIGGILWRPDFAAQVEPLVTGGTGSYSHVETQPEDLPDKFESGTPNLPGVVGLHAALGWIGDTGIQRIAERERELGGMLLEGLSRVEGISLSGKGDMEGRLPVFSFNIEGLDNGLLADALSREGFETRPGLHCAPIAHRTLGSFPQGGLRVSPGYFTRPGQLTEFLGALTATAARLKRGR
ncbi:aminotransferase class V-fold PLP-dependent enzyme [Fretibacterium sp. OH1220_COT-178]|uniref:aminotransferase class V-fold PLP-dependent enzyme n=1 Tax=Fretibacterium sp. OH1220_COT-178 TaxID=2491047 RepID=UPI000F5EE2E7|nr:aminotransferase class V-fold PLP-dependent enzyme [Fretibacterium sp. OH1220_COT-178]RRD65503.1 aminotransferase class V-fold PLP-dependent enzyme [Fretibacterium sp. OH1220_COT-178]